MLKQVFAIFGLCFLFLIPPAQAAGDQSCQEILNGLFKNFRLSERNIQAILAGRTEAEQELLIERLKALPPVRITDLDLFARLQPLPTKDLVALFDVLVSTDKAELTRRAMAGEAMSLAEKRALLLYLQVNWGSLQQLQEGKRINRLIAAGMKRVLPWLEQRRALKVKNETLEQLLTRIQLTGFWLPPMPTRNGIIKRRVKLLRQLHEYVAKAETLAALKEGLDQRVTHLEQQVKGARGLRKLYRRYELDQTKLFRKLVETRDEEWVEVARQYFASGTPGRDWLVHNFLKPNLDKLVSAPKWALGVMIVLISVSSTTVAILNQDLVPPDPGAFRVEDFNLPKEPMPEQQDSFEQALETLGKRLNQGDITPDQFIERYKELETQYQKAAAER